MSEIVYVYVDKRKVIHEIETEARNDLFDYDLILVPKDRATEVLELKEKWKQNVNIKKNLFVMKRNMGEFHVMKTTYIYYHFKDKTIRAISPRRQDSLDKNETLRHGLVLVDDLVSDFINGRKNTLNFIINDADEDFLSFEEIHKKEVRNNIIDNVLLPEDYSIKSEVTDDTKIELRYNGKTLSVKNIKDAEDRTYTLFFVDKEDKTKLYKKMSFDFSESNELNFSVNIDEDFFIISAFRKNMVLIRE